ncbi:response regulator transcription factor [Runella aurantiaca]|uniref:DNA-binding response regulator n=1 Tax=Runella aurantiaca TaxID=2282308 RepID=A0A369IID9_9BACT|nr:LuxR C-terminal-related transcriptional regulator [Runella aurantiaca]RDB08087.1 DNA-binding response regulator [Runella aurantiaca]
MRKTYFLYGLGLGLLLIVLKLIEYQFLVRMHIFEIYGGLIAVLFMGIGIWAGLKFTHKAPAPIIVQVPPAFDENKIKELGISKRELEVLELITQGLTNQEIADKLFVSLNTVKTHSARLFEKLDVNSRTKAINRAKELGILRVN